MPFFRNKFYTRNLSESRYFLYICCDLHHLNCFLLSSLAGVLNDQFSGCHLSDCLGRKQDEIIFLFGNSGFRCVFTQGESRFLKAGSEAYSERLFSRRFPSLIGEQLIQAASHPFERSFHLEFSNGDLLVFKCHGKRSNVILFNDKEAVTIFRSNLQSDWKYSLPVTHEFKPGTFCDTLQNGDALQKVHPFLPDEFCIELESEPSVENETMLLKKFNNIGGIRPSADPACVVPAFEGNTLLDDLDRWNREQIRIIRFHDKKEELLANLRRAIRDKEALLNDSMKALSELKNKRSDEETANIILAGLQDIPPGESIVTLNDIYRNGTVQIRLDNELTPVEFAEQLFKKSKKEPVRIKLLEDKILQCKTDLETLKKELVNTLEAVTVKELRLLEKNTDVKKKDEELPFRKFYIEQFEVLVGKNAAGNDRILNEFSEKDDLWMHARDVSGSHVLIRTRRQKKLPESVLEKAAGLAAWYSKSRKQGLVSVSCTERKYVRKVKGAAKGLVTLSKEKNLLVPPLSPDNL